MQVEPRSKMPVHNPLTMDAPISSQESAAQAAFRLGTTTAKPAALKIALLADAAHVNVQRWCEGLTQAGAEVHVLSFRVGESHGWKVYPLPVSRLPGKLQYVAYVPYVRRMLKKLNPHLLASYYVTGYGTLGSLTGFHPIVQVTSGSDVLLAVRNPLLKRLVRFNLEKADLVTSWAPHLARAAQELGATENRTLVLPRGIPFRQFANARCSPPTNNDSARIISTRSLKSDYNLDLLLKALHALRETGLSFSLTMAGEGPERNRLVALSRDLGLEHNVEFVGFVPNDKLPSLLAEHDLYVSLVDSDGVSASLLEAMAVGLLPIVPDHPANRTWIKPGNAGLLLDDLSPEGVARVIAQALTDLALRQQAWAENSEIVRSYADLYRNSELFVVRFRELVADYPAKLAR